MTYRVMVDGRIKAVKRDFDEAKKLAQIEAFASGHEVDIEEAEAGNKWTEVELVFSNGSEVSTEHTPALPDTLFGSFDREPVGLGGSPTFDTAFRSNGPAKPNARFQM